MLSLVEAELLMLLQVVGMIPESNITKCLTLTLHHPEVPTPTHRAAPVRAGLRACLMEILVFPVCSHWFKQQQRWVQLQSLDRLTPSSSSIRRRMATSTATMGHLPSGSGICTTLPDILYLPELVRTSIHLRVRRSHCYAALTHAYRHPAQFYVDW